MRFVPEQARVRGVIRFVEAGDFGGGGGVACASGDESREEITDQGEEDITQQDDALTSGRYHFNVVNPSAAWNPGCGQPRPDGTPCPFGLSFTYTKNYIDLTFTYRVTVNNRSHVITIKTDTWSNSRVHSRAAVSPQTISLSPSALQIGQAYTVVTTNYRGRELARLVGAKNRGDVFRVEHREEP